MGVSQPSVMKATFQTSHVLRRAMESLVFADADMVHCARERIRDMLRHGDDRTAVRAINAMWLGEKMLLELAGEEAASVSIEATLDAALGDNSQRQEVYRLMQSLSGGRIGDNLPQLSPDDANAANSTPPAAQ